MVKYEIVLKHLFRFRNAALCCARGNYCFKDRVTIYGHYGDNIRRLSGVTIHGDYGDNIWTYHWQAGTGFAR